MIYSHSLPAGLYANEPGAAETGCYRNITDDELRKIYGGNMMRVWKTAWK